MGTVEGFVARRCSSVARSMGPLQQEGIGDVEGPSKHPEAETGARGER